MYLPDYFRSDDPERVHRLIREYPFALLLTHADRGLSHLPFRLDGRRLVGHMARANGQWRAFPDGGVTVVFQGPHAYISPAWYPPSPKNVPTWNYVVAHVHGRARVIEDRNEAWREMRALVAESEANGGTGWELDEAAAAKLAGIVVFEVAIESIEGKLKLSQQQSPAIREGVVRALEERGDALADWML